MKLAILLSCLFLVLFIGTNFVNKYVLSVLRFTYPTIFQGWQSLVGVIMFRALISTGHVDHLLVGKQWHDCALWLPGMMCFLVSIYSGSRALSDLPIPVFFAMQNITLVFRATADLVFHRRIVSVYSYCMLMATVVSALFVARTDPQYTPDGYMWMCIHIFTLGIFEVYTHLIRGRLKLRHTERLFCCYLYSVVVFAPCSYFLGDALEASKFPYLYFAKFYVGCIFSGVLGMLMNLTAIRLHEVSASSAIDIGIIQGLAKITCACASLGFYEMKTSHAFVVCLAVNHLCSFGFSESTTHWRKEIPDDTHSTILNIMGDEPDEKSKGLQISNGAPIHLKRQELQQDLIRSGVV